MWWSHKVTWLSEWRAYCAEGAVLDLQRMPHTPSTAPEVQLRVVEAAAKALHREGGASGVVLDSGVLPTGETALVEANDGFSFGAYGSVAGATMWRVWAARWSELARSVRS